MKHFRRQAGFTLIEIAIVLVIIGLVLFGVLKGTEMVRSGKIKKSAKQFEQLQAGVFAYADKNRGAYPGEVSGTPLADMKTAGLISDDAPKNGFGGDVEAAWVTGPPAGVRFVSKDMPTDAAEAIDQSFDDSNTATGNMALSGVDLNFFVPK